MVKKWGQRIYLAVIFLFLYLPILVLIVLSFNNSRSRVVWGGFTLKWYASCFTDETIMNAFVTTLQITLTAAIASTVIGTLAAIGISAMKKKNRTIMLGATNIPLLNADIVTGISMMLLFVKFMNLGFVTVLIAHITFDVPYVILNVLPKLNQTNRYTYEAALDLGATPMYAFYKVTGDQIRCIFRIPDGGYHVARRFFHHLFYQRCRRQHPVNDALHGASQGGAPGIVRSFNHFIFVCLSPASCHEPPFGQNRRESCRYPLKEVPLTI